MTSYNVMSWWKHMSITMLLSFLLGANPISVSPMLNFKQCDGYNSKHVTIYVLDWSRKLKNSERVTCMSCYSAMNTRIEHKSNWNFPIVFIHVNFRVLLWQPLWNSMKPFVCGLLYPLLCIQVIISRCDLAHDACQEDWNAFIVWSHPCYTL